VIKGQNSSHTETSKLTGVFWRMRSSAVRPYASCIQSNRLRSAPCVFTAPFGFPVEPEV
jgi:hypothetical protein